ncbi:hypothetical protein OSB04_012083 [Centaurea solstitialis]|uniref:Uncharacterized protein n=1 Tax=Centaurea solstitialis TaxID=347529 RepID=A0AA38TCG0_9ASTR|nr:hypothetical protein OSB04_012083 [Centaurea solstitialis]
MFYLLLTKMKYQKRRKLTAYDMCANRYKIDQNLGFPSTSSSTQQFSIENAPRIVDSASSSNQRQHSTPRMPQPYVSHAYSDLGDCTQVCQFCNACFWYAERLKGHDSYG